MASKSEIGHAKNVANLQDLIAFVTGYGPNYSPSRTALMLPGLNTLSAAAQEVLADVIPKNVAFNNAVNDRMVEFSPVPALATKIINALIATGASPEKIADARYFVRKIQGKKAPAPAIDPNVPAPKTISTIQQSYDQQIQHLAGLLAVIQSEPAYEPNETELKVSKLTTRIDLLTQKNNAVATAYTSLSNARIERNQILYDKSTGLVAIAAAVKSYIKSVFGAASPQYAQVKGIAFRTIKT